MGLDFNCSKAHWAYGGFMRFRQRIAESIGIPPLLFMEGFWKQGNYNDPMIKRREEFPNLMAHIDKCLPISWDILKPDPIYVLLYHSDRDGKLTPKECEVIAPRLKEIINKWEEDDGAFLSYDKKNGLLLAEGMEYCAKKRKSLKFQ